MSVPGRRIGRELNLDLNFNFNFNLREPGEALNRLGRRRAERPVGNRVSDRDRFGAEAMPWVDAVYRAAMALCGDPAVADDLAQTTYLKAWERFDRYEAGTNCRAWLMQILRNTWFDRLRKHQPVELPHENALEQLAADAESPEPPPPGDVAGYLEQMDDERLVAALGSLPEDFRLALFLVDVEEYSHEEAAEMLGVAVGTVKSRTSRARKMLRQALAEVESEEGSRIVGGGEND